MKKIEPFSIKFGTPKPVPFVERYDMPGIEVDVAARVAGSVDVSECDKKAFASGQDPAAELKNMMPQLVAATFAKLSAVSVVKNVPEGVEKELEAMLAQRGMTAKVKIVSFALTEESRDVLKQAVCAVTPEGSPRLEGALFRADVQADRGELERDIGSVRREVPEIPAGDFGGPFVPGENNPLLRREIVEPMPDGTVVASSGAGKPSSSGAPQKSGARQKSGAPQKSAVQAGQVAQSGQAAWTGNTAPGAKPVPRFCSRCGARRNPDARFCVKCGVKFQD